MAPARPLAGPANTAPTERAAEASHALVVESDVGSAGIVCRSLTELGFHVQAVASGVAAVIAARQSAPSIIFLSVQLNDVDGAELAGWLRANPALKTVPIVAMHSSVDDTPDLGTTGFNAKLRKPTSAVKIAEVVREICEKVP